MTYSIKQVAEKTGLSIYTLRFYDKQGLLPFVARNRSGYRAFTDGDLNLLKTICCLKETGMKISDIRLYVNDVMAGPTSIPHRKQLLQQHRQQVVEHQRQLAANLAELDEKLATYEDPAAVQIISQKQAFAIAEKRQAHLPNVYEG
ncbi:MerR family transcriptional regulator [Secundilactobacillus muriivasis]